MRKMARTIRARYHNGHIEPLESLPLEEGEEITVTVIELPPAPARQAGRVRQTAGAWKGLVDAEELKQRIRENRLIQTRPEPKL